MAPASHLQSTDAEHDRLRVMCKAWSSDVDGRCDGEEISLRDQKVGTSYLDRVKEDVSQEYFTLSPRLVVQRGPSGCRKSFQRLVSIIKTEKSISPHSN